MRSNVEWLHRLLIRNADTTWLRRYGSPKSLVEYRANVPLCRYGDLSPFLERLQAGEPDVLFAGMPVAYERTGGSSGGGKLIPYSEAGLSDIQRNIQPWLERTFSQSGISGKVYFSVSPATRKPEHIGRIPVGLPDTAYLGDRMGRLISSRTAVPLEVATIRDVSEWRTNTISHLSRANDLELISVWSPTFLLRLLEHIPDAAERWPRLKLISCWADGPSREYANQLRNLLPQATIQPKGLMATEAVMTVPDEHGELIPVTHGFLEFRTDGDACLLEEELEPGKNYEVVVTTASGLYRYLTGDFVRFSGRNESRRPILEFVGRGALICDLVGEKLAESFVKRCLDSIPGFSLLIPNASQPGYVLVSDHPLTLAQMDQVESRLRENPQYAYARDIGQLAQITVINSPSAMQVYEQRMLDQGVRLCDIKPVALRKEEFWLPYFMERFR